MIQLFNDYEEGCAPQILARLEQTNLEQTVGYGEDDYCASARARILALLDCPQAQVHFLVGGTQTNAILLTAALRPHQGVLCADTGHIAVHESGAIEAGGHKVLTLPSVDGKIRAADVENACRAHWNDATHEHMVQPAMVYLSYPTELGTLYTRAELEAMHDVCERNGLLLFVDGARLGYGLAAPDSDVDLPLLARLTDAFYIGGTKVGALFGEALVLTNPSIQRDFRYIIKQRGGMLAKGRLLGIQFDTLFTDGLYFQLGRHAVDAALRIRAAFREKGVPMLVDSPTNQQFPILTETQLNALSETFAFSFWERLPDGRVAVRVCTSWATPDAYTDALCAAIRQL